MLPRFFHSLVLIACVVSLSIGAEPQLAPDEFFDQQVQPILAKNCFKCHGAEAKIKGGFTMTNREALLAGGDSGSVIESDVLIEAINYDGYEMPPSGKLPEEDISILTKWVKLNLPWSKKTEDFGYQGDQHVEHGPPAVNAENMEFWAYQRVQRPATPAVRNADWIQNPIDGFVLSKLEKNNLAPNPTADKTSLLRRAYYDLTGLPPTLDEVKAFLGDTSSDAFEKVVDRLLESPQYGERWGRHWLDVVRYAESNSFERDGAKPHIWRYRDYVIESFNEDKPYDQFVREQLAGDELDEVTPATYIATGYYRIGQWDDEPTDQVQADFDALDDVVATTGQVFLGMTINCARCHDHKIDPIPQSDYYSMLAFFRGVKPYGHRSLDDANTRIFDKETNQQVERTIADRLTKDRQRLEKIVRQVENKVKKELTPPEKEDFAFEANRVAMIRKRPELIDEKRLADYEQAIAKLKDVQVEDDKFRARTLTAFGVSETGSDAPATHIMVRGNAHVLGDEVQPRFPSVLGFGEPHSIEATNYGTTGRRKHLARWITSPANPLTARVMVNRIWQHHFGRGIVDTPNDFGFQGARPTHPKLLDWLAHEFVSGGWKIKRLHKLIMLSSTYRMSSQGNAAALAVDPGNTLLWRMNMRRLSAEEIRDSILAANGTLNLKSGGPSIYPKIPASVLAGQSRPGAGWGNSSPEEAARRSVYIHVKRSLITPILASFDFADTDSSCPVRFATTQPTQALGMLNSEFLNEQASLFSERIRKEKGDVEPAVAEALSIATSRTPSEEEIARGVTFVQELREQHELSEEDAMQQFCLMVLSLNEFIYLD